MERDGFLSQDSLPLWYVTLWGAEDSQFLSISYFFLIFGAKQLKHHDNREHLSSVVPLQYLLPPLLSHPIPASGHWLLCKLQQLSRSDQRDSSEKERNFQVRVKEKAKLLVTLVYLELLFLSSSLVVWEPTKTITSVKWPVGNTGRNCRSWSSSSQEVLLPLWERYGCLCPHSASFM